MTPSVSDLLNTVLPSAKLTPSGWWTMPCPFCIARVGTPGRGRKLGVRDDTGVFHCFRCGAVGKVPGARTRDLKRMTEARAASGVAAGPNEAFSFPESFTLLCDEPGASALSLADARAYVASRNVPAAVQRAVHLGACTRGKFAGRVIVPLFPDASHDIVGEQHGRTPDLWGFIGRAWVAKEDCDMPYLYPTGMPKGVVLYNQSALWVPTEEPAGVVEGSFDTFPLHPDGVAVLGDIGDMSDEQFWMFADARRPVCTIPDGDAWAKGHGIALRLRIEGQRAGCVVLPPKTDPDEVPTDLLREHMWRAIEADDALSWL